MEFRYVTKTQSRLHLRPCAEIVGKAQEYAEKYRVGIEIYNHRAEECQADSADGINISELLFMALGPESELEIVVRGDNTIDVLQQVAHGVAGMLSREYDYPAAKILHP